MAKAGKALVTGGAGFIGSNLVDRLIHEGHEVLVIDNLATGHLENVHPDAEFEEVDITGEEFPSIFEEWKPEIVFHLAAQANVRLSLEDPIFDTQVNAQGTLKVLESSRKNGVKKIVFSSTGGAIYGEPESIPCDEKHSCKPLCLYGANKLVAEHYLDVYKTSFGLPYTVIRFPNIYGPKQSPKGEAGVVAIFAEKMLTGQEPVIFGDGTKTRDYVHVNDAVTSLIMAVDAEDGKIYNIGTGIQTTDQEVFDSIAAATGYGKPAIHGDFRAGEVFHIALDSSLIQKELGWKPTFTFREGIEQAIPFYKKKYGVA